MMKKYFLMTSIFSFVFYSSMSLSFGKEDSRCNYVVIENEAVNLNNVRDQDSVGWCYAYVASDLLSFKLNERISAVSLYDSSQSIERNVSSVQSVGGDVSLAIKNYLKKNNGLCLEKDLPSSDFWFCADLSYREFLLMLFDETNKNRVQSLLDSNQCFAENIHRAFPKIDKTILKQFTEESRAQLIEKIYSFHCKRLAHTGFKPEIEKLHDPFHQNSKVLLAKIHEELNEGNLSSVGYRYNIVNRQEDGKNASHTSIVVGRRMNEATGKCEFLLRNSWGKTCMQNEDADLSCHRICDSFGCRASGHFWVSEERLLPALFDVTNIAK